MSTIRPFRVEISDAEIDDLRDRLARARWPEKEPVDDWSMGIPLAYVQELAGYWAESYEMQRVADQLNRYELPVGWRNAIAARGTHLIARIWSVFDETGFENEVDHGRHCEAARAVGFISF